MSDSEPSPQARTSSMPTVDRPRFRAEHLMAVLGILAVLALVAVFTARPAYRQVKRWRAVGMVQEVPKLLEGTEEDLKEAGSRVRSALGLAPQDPEVLRATARYCTRVGIVDSLTYWGLLRSTGKATPEDLKELVRVAIPMGRLDLADDCLAPLLKASPKDAEILRLATQVSLRRGRIGKALVHARAAFDVDPADATAELALADLQQRMPDRAQQADGRRRILKLAAAAGPVQEQALARIIHGARISRPEAENLLRAIGGHTNPSVRLQLAAASIRIGLEPTNRSAVIRQMAASALASTNETVRSDFAGWALEEGGAAELLELFPAKADALDPLAVGVRLEAAATLGRWDELDQLSTNATSRVPRALIHSFNAVRFHRQKQAEQATSTITEAVNSARTNPRELTLVALTAEKIGRTNVAIGAWQKLLEHPLLGLNAAQNVVRLSASMDDLTASRSALERIHELNPANRAAARRLAYLNLLLGTQVSEAQAIFREQAGDSDSPDTDPIARLGLAFAEWRTGNAAAGLAIAEKHPIEFEKLPPHWQAVYVGLLGAADRRAAARDHARRVSLAALRPIERGLVEPWR